MAKDLTRREREVLAMMDAGAGPTEIASALGITPQTARTYGRRVRLRARGPTGESSLSARERQVVALMRQHLHHAEIGRKLGISTRTVESHASEVLRKLGLRSRRELAGAIPLFTPREVEIGQLVAQGLTDTEVAARLGIGTRTVEEHVAAIFRKLGINRRIQLQHAAQLLLPTAPARQ